MSEKDKKDPNRRDFIITATATVGAVGVGAAVWPLIDQMNPDASVKALASTEVDVSNIQPGQSITVLWRGKPVFIKRRTNEEIEKARSVDLKELKKRPKVDVHHFNLIEKLKEAGLKPADYEPGAHWGTDELDFSVHNYEDRSGQEIINTEKLNEAVEEQDETIESMENNSNRREGR